MIKTTLNWTIKNLKTMHANKETLCFDHPIQRQSSQWNNLQQSLLVHSILANFPVPAVYVEKADSNETDEKGKPVFKYSVLDGKQRMTTIFSFIDGEYALNEETPAVEIEGTRYELANKTFEELDEDVKQELLRFKFQIFAFEECDDDMIEEIFFRLNNSTPLTKPQKSKPLMGTTNARFIDDILKGTFFREKCNFSQLQLRKSDDMCTLLQSMMLLDNKYGYYEYTSISADEVMKYSSHIKNNYSYEQQIILTTAIDYLNQAFDSKEKLLKKVNIPMAIILADIALTKGIKAYDFHNWFLYFFVACKNEYGQYCSSGSIKKEKVLGRLETMTNHFYKHFRIDDTKEIIENEATIENADEQEEVLHEEDIPETEVDEETVDTTHLDEESDTSPIMAISEEVHSEEEKSDEPIEEFPLSSFDESLSELGAMADESSTDDLLMVSE